MRCSRRLLLLVDTLTIALITCTILIGISYTGGADRWIRIFSNFLLSLKYAGQSQTWIQALPSNIRDYVLPDFYEALGRQDLPDDGWFRLCTFVDARGGLDILCERFERASAPPYRALSYTWGPAFGRPEDIDSSHRTDFGGTIKTSTLPKNVMRALLRLAKLDEGTPYDWVDFMCINQGDLQEREQQVSIMYLIYQEAEAVDVWLGPSGADLERFQIILARLSAAEHEQGSLWRTPREPLRTANQASHLAPVLSERDWQTLTDFFSRRWFHRLWALQEYALGKSVRLICGDYFVYTENLTAAARYLFTQAYPMEMWYGKNDIAGSAIVQQSLLRDVMANVSLLSEYLPSYSKTQIGFQYEALLAWIYWRSAATFATDARDYVYGILGVTAGIWERLAYLPGNEMMRNTSYAPIIPDYSISSAEVFQMFTSRLLYSSLGVRAISLIQPGPQNEYQRRKAGETLDLPSWVPNLADRDRLPLSSQGALTTSTDGAQSISVFGSAEVAQRLSKLVASYR